MDKLRARNSPTVMTLSSNGLPSPLGPYLGQSLDQSASGGTFKSPCAPNPHQEPEVLFPRLRVPKSPLRERLRSPLRKRKQDHISCQRAADSIPETRGGERRGPPPGGPAVFGWILAHYLKGVQERIRTWRLRILTFCRFLVELSSRAPAQLTGSSSYCYSWGRQAEPESGVPGATAVNGNLS